MFEYLMPGLVMRAPAGSLLEQSGRLVVRRQITYGAERGVPWGVSESGLQRRATLEQTYQYSNFGRAGSRAPARLSEDVVIGSVCDGIGGHDRSRGGRAKLPAALGSRRQRRLRLLRSPRLHRLPLPEETRVAVVRTYMAHHQGMLLVAIANVLHAGAMRARFHAEPIVQATELLLQERTPRDVAVARPRAEEVTAVADVREFIPPVVRRFHLAARARPYPHPVQRALRGDAHRRGLRL